MIQKDLRILKSSHMYIFLFLFFFVGCVSNSSTITGNNSSQDPPINADNVGIEPEIQSDLQPENQPETQPNSAESIEPSEPYNRVAAALIIGDTEEAISAYESIDDADSQEAQVHLSYLYILANKVDEAQAILDNLDSSNSTNAKLAKALLERIQGNRESEIGYLEQIIELEPNHIRANTMLGELSLEDKNYTRARDYFLQALETEEDNLFALQGLGQSYLRNGDLKEAVDTFTQVIELDPEFSYNYIDRARSYSSQGYYEGAIADANTAIALEDDNGWHYFDRGRIHARRLNYAMAAEDFIQALKYLPNNFLARAMLAQMQGFLGEYELAIANFNSVLQVEPDYYPAFPFVGAIEYILGNYDRSGEFLLRSAWREDDELASAFLLFVSLGLFANSDFEAKNFLAKQVNIFNRESILYEVRQFYLNSADYGVLSEVQRHKDRFFKALAQFYLGMRYLQLDMPETARALLSSEEQILLAGRPENMVAQWVLDNYK